MIFGQFFGVLGGQFGPFPLMNRAQDHDNRPGGVENKRSVPSFTKNMVCDPVSRHLLFFILAAPEFLLTVSLIRWVDRKYGGLGGVGGNTCDALAPQTC